MLITMESIKMLLKSFIYVRQELLNFELKIKNLSWCTKVKIRDETKQMEVTFWCTGSWGLKFSMAQKKAKSAS